PGATGGARDAARQLNLSRRDIQRSKAVAGLSDEAKAEAARLLRPVCQGAGRYLHQVRRQFRGAGGR
ncbi:MAG: hypothetical protein ACK4QW_10005, partial [Alphaproteobacteria bacterium]